MELKKFTSRGQRDLSYLRSHPPPPSAGFDLALKDMVLNTSAGALPIFAQLATVKSRKLKAPEILSRRVTNRVNLESILARRRVGRGSGGEAGRPTNRPKRLKILTPTHPPPVVS